MKNKFYIVADESEHQKKYGEAVKFALENFGIECVREKTVYFLKRDFKNICLWGWRRGKNQLLMGRNILVIERGFIDRMNHVSLSFNGLNGFADFGDEFDTDEKKFEKFKYLMKPWKGEQNFNNKKPAVILGQTPGDMSLRGYNLEKWYEKIAKQIKDLHNIEVIFRPHPNVIKKNIPIKNCKYFKIDKETSLEDLLNDCSFAVTFNSNSAIDSLLNGTQIVVYDKGSMVFNDCPNTVYDVNFNEPNRNLIFENLARKQYTEEEVKSGEWIKKFTKYIYINNQEQETKNGI